MRRQYFDALPNANITSTVPSSRNTSRPQSAINIARRKEYSKSVALNSQQRKSHSPDAEGDATSKKRPDSAFALSRKRIAALCEQMEHEPGMKPFAEFYKWCIQKFRNLTRAWRLLDTSLNMRLTYLEFLTSLKEHGYKGDGRVIFKILDRDRSGSLSYFHFDPSGALALATIVTWAETTFGNVQDAFEKLDDDRNGKLSPEEFRRSASRHGLESEEPVTYLFQMLDLDKDHVITKKELAFLDAWGCPSWLKVKPDPEGCRTFIDHLIYKYRDNPILAWHNLDQNDQMRVSWDEFFSACRKLGLKLDEKRLSGVWRALDENLSGWVALHEFSPDAYNLLVKFKKWAEKTEGGIGKLLNKIDTSGDGLVTKKELAQIRADLDLSDQEFKMLFEGFDHEGKGVIKYSRFRYLDLWNVEEDIKEEKFWNSIWSCLTAKVDEPDASS